jgi:hypothetical protein
VGATEVFSLVEHRPNHKGNTEIGLGLSKSVAPCEMVTQFLAERIKAELGVATRQH